MKKGKIFHGSKEIFQLLFSKAEGSLGHAPTHRELAEILDRPDPKKAALNLAHIKAGRIKFPVSWWPKLASLLKVSVGELGKEIGRLTPRPKAKAEQKKAAMPDSEQLYSSEMLTELARLSDSEELYHLARVTTVTGPLPVTVMGELLKYKK